MGRGRERMLVLPVCLSVCLSGWRLRLRLNITALGVRMVGTQGWGPNLGDSSHFCSSARWFFSLPVCIGVHEDLVYRLFIFQVTVGRALLG